MFLRILKNDLKRKKTMNVIILLFVILSVMFFSSSVNNIVSVAGGLDRFLEISGMKDYAAFVNEPDSGEPFAEQLKSSGAVKGYKRSSALSFSPECMRNNGEHVKSMSNIINMVCENDCCTNYFDKNNEKITDVEKGKVYITNGDAVKMGIKTGDKISIELFDEKVELEVAGTLKDVFGSSLIGFSVILADSSDFDMLYSNDYIRNTCRMGIYVIESTDNKAVEEIIGSSDNIRLNCSRTMVKMSYMIDITVTGIVMAVSIFLIVISFVVLRFTIRFTISEEFREIGVMKAIGLKNRSIRGLYMVKYLGLSVVGAVIGYFAAIPFGKLLLDSASGNMILGNDNPVLIGIICAAAVILLITLFCFGCTSSINKLSPIDAVRSGQTGERFSKRSVMSLGRSKLGTSGFLSLNNIISSPKQSFILVLVFTLCTMMVIILSNMAQTMSSEKLMCLLSIKDSDAYINLSTEINNIRNGVKTIDEVTGEIEATLAENDMPGNVFVEPLYSVSLKKGENRSNARFFKCSDTKTTDYYYNEGTAPQYENEIALGSVAAEEIGANIGDKVLLTLNGEEKEYIVTALFESFSNVGFCGRFHESVEIPDDTILFTMAFQIDFDDSPDDETIAARIEKLKEIYDTDNVFDKSGYVDDCTKTADTLNRVKQLTFIVSVMIIALMSVLLERSFISKERSEIALMKAIGFKNRSVIGIHTLRFMLITVISIALAVTAGTPVTRLIMKPIFTSIGGVTHIILDTNKVETLLILPCLVFATVLLSTWSTALYMGKIRASDTANIE